MTFRARLLLAAFYLSTAVVLALAIPLALTVERRADSDYEAAVLGDAAILAARISDLVVSARASRGSPPPGLARIVGERARVREQRVVVTDAAGQVVADSDGVARLGAFFATDERPEFRAALFQGRIDTRRRFSDTLGEDLLLVTVPVVDRGRVVGAVRLSAGTRAIETQVRESWLRLTLLGVVVVVAGALVAWLLELPLGRQIRRLAEASSRLGRGELAARVPERGPTELRVLASSFNQMAAELEGSIEAQREFVANASHQLRTPLTGLRLRLEAIKSAGGPAAEQATKAEAELDRLANLVDDLLALARATAVDSTAGPVELGDLAREAVARWRQAAAAAGKHLALEERGAPRVWGNRDDLAQVLDNLIDNALRYSPSGAEVRVETDAGDGNARLSVSDDGPGIPPEDRARIFDRFYRGATARGAGSGTGLGLAIVAEHVQRWRGEIRLVDAPGTRLEAVFPLLPTER